MSNPDRPTDLPAERERDSDLEELEPHQRTIERVARAYYGACEEIARTIRRIKSHLADGSNGE